MTNALTVRHLDITSAEVSEVLDILDAEYRTRYREFYTDDITAYPVTDFTPPDGAFIGILESDLLVAAGAIRRYDSTTAEVKRMWTRDTHRRRGFAQRVLRELDAAAGDLGYTRIFLTTGSRQPEAVALYRASGFEGGERRIPEFDLPVFAFEKPVGRTTLVEHPSHS
ncbi:GNAT family N-acetyltransferase [Pseudoclavibacter sp. RFBJ3]|uniref:GNAT family N-acetyltransferase n=1 Tax=unclassified Pseudoclavibacter TaxID=2615177 RepID=UPI000CE8E74F|nr:MULTISPECIES: GNAT family N-acetyltransferase [unclassified Pseudoclavibacter]PPF84074.1 GNAT family N-acetyltransferase [Pseudoclavibacter sp. RFBJ5]PPF92354.1 GNAT family N-acetyltransferase [Pseudoclavibacter sp. RFBJ3]PPF97217.1 GNAT family N-acetyltransferase [Pseudoclavibacter sp. RFBH5]PPG23903.1 GNAT family N-acetyltransferase [Pseudoclavibacter sp. RFBI4]